MLNAQTQIKKYQQFKNLNKETLYIVFSILLYCIVKNLKSEPIVMPYN